VILAGGRSSRFGRPKAWATLGGVSFIERIHRLFLRTFEETVVALHEPDERFAKMKVIYDLYPTRSPMNGIYSALVETSAKSAFVASCDLPLLKSCDVGKLLSHWEEDMPALVYQRAGKCEPLCGIYNHTLIPMLRTGLKQGKYSLRDLLEKVEAIAVDYTPLSPFHSLTNVNSSGEYQKLLKWKGESEPGTHDCHEI
jgi:molybdopterin-guanine dinucleotide biosynthesis protein A